MSDHDTTADESHAEALASLGAKLQVIRDRVRGVAAGFSNGLYLWGEGGTGKTYSVTKTLEGLKCPFRLTNSRLSGKGLFDLLRDGPDIVHVIDDAETLFDDRAALGVLRSALWGQQGGDFVQERLVVWQTGKSREEVVFTGGVVMAANRPLADKPEERAVKTRIPCVRYAPTPAEVAALMRDIAKKGHRHGRHSLSPADCLEVAEEVIARSLRLGRTPDLRLLVNGLTDRIQYEAGCAETHWVDLLAMRVTERPDPSGPGGEPRTRAGKKSAEQEVARKIADLEPAARLAAWREATGKSQAALYRRLAELADQGEAGPELSVVG